MTAKERSEGMSPYRSQSLIRGLSILRVLAAARTPLTLHELHERSQIPKPTLVRLLSILTQEACTVRIDDRPTYSLGPTVVEIAAGVDDDMDPEALARPVLEALCARVGHTVNLGALSGGEVLHVSVVLADRPVRYTAHSGSRDATWCTGLGKALLAFSAPATVRATLTGRRLTRRTARTITTKAALDAELVRIRQQGFSHDDEECADGLRCFAVPIIAHGECVGAVSCSGPAAELPMTAAAGITPLLTETAELLARDGRLVRGLRSLSGM